MDLQKVEQLEEKIKLELETLTNSIKQMEEELITYSDLEKLKRESDDKKKVRDEDPFSMESRSYGICGVVSSEIFPKNLVKTSGC